LLQFVVQLPQPVLIHQVGGDDLEPGWDVQVGEAGDGRIGGDGVGVLPAVDHEAHGQEAFAQLSIGFADLGVEVPADVLGDGLHEWFVRDGVAGAEDDEAPGVGSHQRCSLPNGHLLVVGRPTVGCLGDNDVHGLDPTGAGRTVLSLSRF
jgi:hypothetical protein